MVSRSFVQRSGRGDGRHCLAAGFILAMLLSISAAVVGAQPGIGSAGATQVAAEPRAGGEANLVLPDLDQTDVGGYSGRTLLTLGLVVAFGGVLFGLGMLRQIRNLPVHAAMSEVSDLIYETCKIYLLTQGRFLALLFTFIA